MEAHLERGFREAAGTALAEHDVDGWLLYDLEGRNRIATEILDLGEGLSRRCFVLIRPGRSPVALGHAIERQPWSGWEGEFRTYVGWREMEGELREMLAGCRRVAMEVSKRDAVPFVDYVPAGVRELVEACGPEVVSSAPLISMSCARWGERGRELHERAGAVLARVAAGAFQLCARRLSDGEPPTEYELSRWVHGEVASEGLGGGGNIVAFGPTTANPHYEPPEEGSRRAAPGDVFLLDLWARVQGETDAVFADQTWMGVLGEEPTREQQDVWSAVRDARDATVEFIRERAGSGEPPSGAEADRAARSVLRDRGFTDEILHRTGHAMDRVNHGFGPNLDSVETRDERELLPGVGFSVEPGVYLEGEFGVRSEINVHMGADGPEVTTPDVQRDLWRL